MIPLYPLVFVAVIFMVTGFKCKYLTSWLAFLCHHAKAFTHRNTYYFVLKKFFLYFSFALLGPCAYILGNYMWLLSRHLTSK